MFARRDGHHTRQPETIQEFPGDSRPSLHKMSSLSIAVYLWGYLPPLSDRHRTGFLLPTFLAARGEGAFRAGWGRLEKETEGLGAGGGGGWGGGAVAPGMGRASGVHQPPGLTVREGQSSPQPRLHKARAGGRRSGRPWLRVFAITWPTNSLNEI